MPFPPKSKPFTQFPHSDNLTDAQKQALDYMLTQINQLSGQANPPSGKGIQTFGTSIIDPTSAQIVSGGSRTASVTTAITFNAAATSISFFWDGTNGSKPFTIYRDDNTVTGPTITGSPYTVTGLAPATPYFFYFYWDESLGQIRAATNTSAVGSPQVAFPSGNLQAAQQQYLRGHIPLAPAFANAGVTTGSGGGSGGGGGGGGGGNCPISGAPVRLYGDPGWWKKTIVPCAEFIEVITDSGRRGVFSPRHRMYSNIGLFSLQGWRVGDRALTEDGEETVVSLKTLTIPYGTVDSYEATKGHIYSAWGFVCHNLKPF